MYVFAYYFLFLEIPVSIFHNLFDKRDMKENMMFYYPIRLVFCIIHHCSLHNLFCKVDSEVIVTRTYLNWPSFSLAWVVAHNNEFVWLVIYFITYTWYSTANYLCAHGYTNKIIYLRNKSGWNKICCYY